MKKEITQFKKGNIPYNKGTHLTNSGSFKKGHKMLGISIGEIMKGKPSQMKGKKHTDEAKGKNRLAHLGNIPWNKGIGNKTPLRKKMYFSPEYKFFRKECFLRDNFTCQISNKVGGDLVVHHINNFADFPELRTSIDNGITLNRDIHNMFHKKYGQRNNTKEQLVEFAQSFIIGQNC